MGPKTTKRTRAAVLDVLREASPEAVGPDRLHDVAGRPYPSRTGDLVTYEGWRIDPVYHEGDPCSNYRLLPLKLGVADPDNWGLRARSWTSSGQ